MIGAIHWNVSTLKKLAPYSLDTTLSFGTGGLREPFRGFRLYHGLFLLGSGLKSAAVEVDLVVVVVRVLVASGLSFFSWSDEDPLSETTYCRGSVATGSWVFV